jgi:TetR/AcrR family transcriptional repressor of nem operon
LEAAKKAGEIDESTDPYEMADFIINSWEGALLRMKAEKSPEPLLLFDRVVFEQVLKR